MYHGGTFQRDINGRRVMKLKLYTFKRCVNSNPNHPTQLDQIKSEISNLIEVIIKLK